MSARLLAALRRLITRRRSLEERYPELQAPRPDREYEAKHRDLYHHGEWPS